MWNVDAIFARQCLISLSRGKSCVLFELAPIRLVSLQIFQTSLFILLKGAVISLLGELREVISRRIFLFTLQVILQQPSLHPFLYLRSESVAFQHECCGLL